MTRCLVFLLFVLCSGNVFAAEKAQNIILFLADAAGIPTLNGASIYGHGEPGKLAVYRMPHLALMDTSAANTFVTDSAAGMTAIVTGSRTNNGVVSQSDSSIKKEKDGQPLKTILEFAEEQGLSTGVITNSFVLSATPAACFAHVNDRDAYPQILSQLLNPHFGDGVDVVMGPSRAQALEAATKLGLDLPSAFTSKGWAFAAALDQLPEKTNRAVVIFEDADFDFAGATRRAIEILSANPKGFFLMVECDVHTDNVIRGLERTVWFDRLVAEVSDTAPDNTLVIFTADHSYDFRVQKGPKDRPLISEEEKASVDYKADTVQLSHVRRDDTHTAEEVIVAAKGPGAERVRGYLANTDLFHIMLQAFGWETVATEQGQGRNACEAGSQ